jgi:hypothetical protein
VKFSVFFLRSHGEEEKCGRANRKNAKKTSPATKAEDADAKISWFCGRSVQENARELF